ncbi:hypothetical protein SCALM49S_00525 [Streptomyces californicus]
MGPLPDSASYPGDHDPEEVLAGYWTDYADDELGDAAPADEASGEPGDGASGEPETGSGTETGSGSGSAGAWPGLAPVPARETAEDPDTAAAGIVAVVAGDADLWLGGTRMALVPARRSADIPAAIGWTGAVNHENDVARLCAVLRSWEDRYDARVVVLGFDTMIVSVGRPPATMEEARALAAEHYAFCPDNIDQSPPYDLDAYAEKAVLDQDAWSFWWD